MPYLTCACCGEHANGETSVRGVVFCSPDCYDEFYEQGGFMECDNSYDDGDGLYDHS